MVQNNAILNVETEVVEAQMMADRTLAKVQEERSIVFHTALSDS